jgi:Ni/Fe-hydrogenase subunit HybB-like protein
VGFSYVTEFFMAWYGGNPFERSIFLSRLTGQFAIPFYIMFFCNALVPNLHFFKKIRTSIPAMFIISILVNVGMWFERFNIIVSSLRNDYLPASWHWYMPTRYDWGVTIGLFGLFFTLFLLFVRVFPAISIAEVKATLPNPVGKTPEGHTHA